MFQSLLLALAVTYGPYRANVLDVLAPDVLKLQVLIWPDATRVVEFHLEGVRGPRLRSVCQSEQLLATDGIDFTRTTVGRTVLVSGVHKNDSGTWFVGRIIGEHGGDLGKALIDAGYAIPATPVRRGDPWCTTGP